MFIKNFHNLIFIFLFFILGGVSSLDGKTLEKEDIDLLNTDEMRGVRMLLEITKPEQILEKENITL